MYCYLLPVSPYQSTLYWAMMGEIYRAVLAFFVGWGGRSVKSSPVRTLGSGVVGRPWTVLIGDVCWIGMSPSHSCRRICARISHLVITCQSSCASVGWVQADILGSFSPCRSLKALILYANRSSTQSCSFGSWILAGRVGKLKAVMCWRSRGGCAGVGRILAGRIRLAAPRPCGAS